MPDYKKGLIYTIRTPHSDNIYIGSTCQPLYKRLFEHKSNFRNHKNGSIRYMSSYKILEFGDEYIELLETYPCNSKMELYKREGELIREYRNVCVNMGIPGRTDKQYYEDNKEKINIKSMKRYCNNKEKLRADAMKRYHKNIDRCREMSRKYRERNKEKLKEKHECGCGGRYTTHHKVSHERTIKHLNFMKQ